MTYNEMCRYIVAREGFDDWDYFLSKSKERRGDFRLPRQICMYIGFVCFKNLTYAEIGGVFQKDHSTAVHAVRTIGGEMENNRNLNNKINAYIKEIKKRIDKDLPNISDITEPVVMTINKMKIIAEAYCELTGKRMIDA